MGRIFFCLSKSIPKWEAEVKKIFFHKIHFCQLAENHKRIDLEFNRNKLIIK